ncbi:hypothetical protein [Prevotella sp.]|uniref:hypothetical protein n=1 Tax=Segatella copri TaxID=165179 RepID=UPI0025810179
MKRTCIKQIFSELEIKKQNRLHGVDDFKILFFIPWFHHQRIIDKYKDDVNKENLSIAEMSGKKLDWFRKVCAAVL